MRGAGDSNQRTITSPLRPVPRTTGISTSTGIRPSEFPLRSHEATNSGLSANDRERSNRDKLPSSSHFTESIRGLTAHGTNGSSSSSSPTSGSASHLRPHNVQNRRVQTGRQPSPSQSRRNVSDVSSNNSNFSPTHQHPQLRPRTTRISTNSSNSYLPNTLDLDIRGGAIGGSTDSTNRSPSILGAQLPVSNKLDGGPQYAPPRESPIVRRFSQRMNGKPSQPSPPLESNTIFIGGKSLMRPAAGINGDARHASSNDRNSQEMPSDTEPDQNYENERGSYTDYEAKANFEEGFEQSDEPSRRKGAIKRLPSNRGFSTLSTNDDLDAALAEVELRRKRNEERLAVLARLTKQPSVVNNHLSDSFSSLAQISRIVDEQDVFDPSLNPEFEPSLLIHDDETQNPHPEMELDYNDEYQFEVFSNDHNSDSNGEPVQESPMRDSSFPNQIEVACIDSTEIKSETEFNENELCLAHNFGHASAPKRSDVIKHEQEVAYYEEEVGDNEDHDVVRMDAPMPATTSKIPLPTKEYLQTPRIRDELPNPLMPVLTHHTYQQEYSPELLPRPQPPSPEKSPSMVILSRNLNRRIETVSQEITKAPFELPNPSEKEVYLARSHHKLKSCGSAFRIWRASARNSLSEKAETQHEISRQERQRRTAALLKAVSERKLPPQGQTQLPSIVSSAKKSANPMSNSAQNANGQLTVKTDIWGGVRNDSADLSSPSNHSSRLASKSKMPESLPVAKPTASTVRESLRSHIDRPSSLAISETLKPNPILQKKDDSNEAPQYSQEDIEAEKELREAQSQLAVLHHARSLVYYHGYLPWRRAFEHTKWINRRAKQQHDKCLLKSALRAWLSNLKESQELSRQKEELLNDKADEVRIKLLRKRGIRSLKHFLKFTRNTHQLAFSQYCFHLRKDAVLVWISALREKERQRTEKLEKLEPEVKSMGRVSLLKFVWRALKRNVEESKEAKLEEVRIRETRGRIDGWLKDFKESRAKGRSVVSDALGGIDIDPANQSFVSKLGGGNEEYVEHEVEEPRWAAERRSRVLGSVSTANQGVSWGTKAGNIREETSKPNSRPQQKSNSTPSETAFPILKEPERLLDRTDLHDLLQFGDLSGNMPADDKETLNYSMSSELGSGLGMSYGVRPLSEMLRQAHESIGQQQVTGHLEDSLLPRNSSLHHTSHPHHQSTSTHHDITQQISQDSRVRGFDKTTASSSSSQQPPPPRTTAPLFRK